jgi:hypothetical protein
MARTVISKFVSLFDRHNTLLTRGAGTGQQEHHKPAADRHGCTATLTPAGLGLTTAQPKVNFPEAFFTAAVLHTFQTFLSEGI